MLKWCKSFTIDIRVNLLIEVFMSFLGYQLHSVTNRDFTFLVVYRYTLIAHPL